jgi:hypothetical protein
MDHNSLARTLISGIIALLAIIGVSFTLPKTTYEVVGIALPGKITNSPSTPENISIYSDESMGNYQSLGLIRIARHYTPDDEFLAQNEIKDKARSLASQLGANAVIVRFFAHSMPGRTPAEMAMYSFWGTAVYK